MIFTVLVTASPTGSKGAYSAYRFCEAALAKNHQINQVFFYGDGVYIANRSMISATDDLNLLTLWQELAHKHAIKLSVCVDAAQKRGILDESAALQEKLPANLAKGFSVTGLSKLIEAVTYADRFITFN